MVKRHLVASGLPGDRCPSSSNITYTLAFLASQPRCMHCMAPKKGHIFCDAFMTTPIVNAPLMASKSWAVHLHTITSW